jgi:hypothetical protein
MKSVNPRLGHADTGGNATVGGMGIARTDVPTRSEHGGCSGRSAAGRPEVERRRRPQRNERRPVRERRPERPLLWRGHVFDAPAVEHVGGMINRLPSSGASSDSRRPPV